MQCLENKVPQSQVIYWQHSIWNTILFFYLLFKYWWGGKINEQAFCTFGRHELSLLILGPSFSPMWIMSSRNPMLMDPKDIERNYLIFGKPKYWITLQKLVLTKWYLHDMVIITDLQFGIYMTCGPIFFVTFSLVSALLGCILRSW